MMMGSGKVVEVAVMCVYMYIYFLSRPRRAGKPRQNPLIFDQSDMEIFQIKRMKCVTVCQPKQALTKFPITPLTPDFALVSSIAPVATFRPRLDQSSYCVLVVVLPMTLRQS